MTPRKKTIDATVTLIGVSAKAEAGRIATKGVSRTGDKSKGRYDHEVLNGFEFNVNGDLMSKVRIIDRKNNVYKELVVHTDTGTVVHDTEHPLTDHTGHGSAKHKS